MTRRPCVSLLIGFLTLALVAAPLRAEDPKSLVFAFQKQSDPTKIRANADKVAAFLSEQLGMPVKVFIPADYSATVQALVSKKADIAYVSAIPFLLARRDGGASLLLAEQRNDAKGVARTEYDSVFVVPKDSPLQSIDDLVKNAGSLRMVFTSSTSTSGYVMAYRRLVNEGLLKAGQDAREVFKDVNFGGSYTQALQQVLDGRGDVCAVSFYTVEGDNADVYLPAEQRAKLRVLARTPGVPTHLVCSRGGLSDELKARVTDALLKLSASHADLLEDVYGAKTLVRVNEAEHVASAVEAMGYLGQPLEKFAK